MLVLVNDVDWELRWALCARGRVHEDMLHNCQVSRVRALNAFTDAGVVRDLCSGQLESELSEEDVVTFISTLHGG